MSRRNRPAVPDDSSRDLKRQEGIFLSTFGKENQRNIDDTAFLAFCGAIPFIREQCVHYLVAPALKRGYCLLSRRYDFLFGLTVHRL